MDDPTKDNTPTPPDSERQRVEERQEGARLSGVRLFASELFSDYGMLAVLLLLICFFSFVTIEKRKPVGAEAAQSVANRIAEGSRVLVVARASEDDRAFAAELERLLGAKGIGVVGSIVGEPRDVRLALEQLVQGGTPVDIIATTEHNVWRVNAITSHVGSLSQVRVVIPESYRWPVFLRSDNLINVANQIVVIAIIAIGMTMVIITGGIDLSVGSLIALSAVVTATLIGRMGGTEASTLAMLVAALGAILMCGVVGLLSGTMVSGFRMPHIR